MSSFALRKFLSEHNVPVALDSIPAFVKIITSVVFLLGAGWSGHALFAEQQELGPRLSVVEDTLVAHTETIREMNTRVGSIDSEVENLESTSGEILQGIKRIECLLDAERNQTSEAACEQFR